MTDIDRELVLKRYQKIIDENGVGAANNTMRVLRALFAYAEHRYEVDKKPVVTKILLPICPSWEHGRSCLDGKRS